MTVVPCTYECVSSKSSVAFFRFLFIGQSLLGCWIFKNKNAMKLFFSNMSESRKIKMELGWSRLVHVGRAAGKTHN